MDIKLRNFEGPLDLLLHLVSQYQMDIYSVPIADVIEQYLAYLATLQAMKLEIAGEYMVMASQLMLIKSRQLLPKIEKTEQPEDNPEQELLTQIEEYRRFKAISKEMSKQHDKRAKFHSKPKQELIFDNVILLHDKTTMDLFLSFSHIMAEKQKEISQNNAVIERDDYRIEDMMSVIIEHLNKSKILTLSDILNNCQTLSEKITIFLAVLELIKNHEIVIEQNDNFGDIRLQSIN